MGKEKGNTLRNRTNSWKSRTLLKNGTFGVTGEAENLEPTIAAAIEKSHFPQIKFLQWRNFNLNFTSVTGLIQSLEQKPTNENFVKADEGIDLKVFKTLSETEPLKGNINSVKDIKLLWEVCQIPDFRKISEFDHSTFLKKYLIF